MGNDTPSIIGQLRCKRDAEQCFKNIKDKATNKEKNEERKKYGLKEHHNPLFRLSVDLFRYANFNRYKLCIPTITRATPVEVLHTVLLGTVKYMVRNFMDKRSSDEKKGILARVSAFPYRGFSVHVNGNICYHYKSFIGRDFKAFMQMALFIITPYVSETEKQC